MKKSIRLIPLMIIIVIVQLVLGKPVWVALVSGFIGAVVGLAVIWAYNNFKKA